MKQMDLEAKLSNALVELIKTTPLIKITVLQLVKTAGVSKSTFYRAYDSVNDFVRSVEDEILYQLRDLAKYTISANICMKPHDKPNEHLDSVFEYLYEIRALYNAITSPNGDPQFRYRETKLIHEMFISKVAYEGYECDHQDCYIVFALAGHNALISEWLCGKIDMEPKEMCMLVQRLMYGLFKI